MINKLAKYIIKNIIQIFYNPIRGRKNKRSLDHYIDVIFKVLKTGMQWHELNTPLHYTTYHKKFILWNKLNIFNRSYHILIKLLILTNSITIDDLKLLSIDSSMIKNIKGVDNIGQNHYDRYRNGNKISVVVTDNGIPLGFSFERANIHDINLVDSTLDDIKIKIVNSKLLSDKGYNSKELKKKLDKKKINLIYPLKKNQKNTMFNENELSLLKSRHIVENFFSWIKNYRRIMVRYEIKLNNYIQFCYLAAINIICNKIF